MNFGLLWIDVLLVSLLWVGLLAACSGRVKRRWIRIAIMLPGVLLPLVYLGFFALGGYLFKYESDVEPNWFGYSVSLFSAFLAATVVLLYQAFRRCPGMLPAAASWGRVSIFVALVIAGTVGLMTLLDIDLAIRARCAVLGVEVNSLYYATLPAMTSDSQNAAPIYEKAFAKMKLAPPIDVKNPPVGDGDTFDPAEPATIRYLTQQAGTIALLHRAAALPACRFDQDLTNPNVDEVVGSINNMRAAARLLRLHARQEAADGHTASAITDADAVMQLAQHCGQRPLLISALCTLGLNAVGDRTLQDVLSSVKNQNELAGLHAPDPTWVRRALQQAFRSEERYFLHSLTTDPSDNAPVGVNTFPPADGIVQRVTFRIFILNPDGYVRIMEQLQRLSLQPYYLAAPLLPNKATAKKDGMFAAMIADPLPREIVDCARSEAGGACGQVAVAMTRYRLDHGNLPTRLAELVPTYLDSIPIDPFDGHELRLAIKGAQYIIYSVGPDGVDDGGADINDEGKGDVTFKLTVQPSAAAPAK